MINGIRIKCPVCKIEQEISGKYPYIQCKPCGHRFDWISSAAEVVPEASATPS